MLTGQAGEGNTKQVSRCREMTRGCGKVRKGQNGPEGCKYARHFKTLSFLYTLITRKHLPLIAHCSNKKCGKNRGNKKIFLSVPIKI